jgi:hypothetical protein
MAQWQIEFESARVPKFSAPSFAASSNKAPVAKVLKLLLQEPIFIALLLASRLVPEIVSV